MGNSTKTYGSALAELDTYLGALQKSAGVEKKTASETSEDPTSHPVENVDDQLDPASEGSRSAENEADVTSDVGPQNINDAAPASDEEPKPVAMTTAATTGEDPSNETAGVKDTKDDPGTTHPAKAAEYLETVKKACAEQGAEKVASDLGNEIMADIACIKAADGNVEKAAEAGAAAADSEIEKLAEAQLPLIVEGAIKEAEADARNLFDYYTNFQKAAEEGAEPEEAVSGEVATEEAGDAGEEGALPVEDLEQLAAVAEGPEGVGAEEAAMGAPAVDPMADPMAEPGSEEVVEALSEALADAGVTPEEFAAAVASQEGAAEAPIEQKMAAVQVANLATSEVNRYRNLKTAGRVSNEKRASIQLVWTVRQMVKDVTGK
jgi:hypothetical protein